MVARSSHARLRRGAAVVEFAVCLPVVAMIILMCMDSVQVVRTKQALVETVHEMSRVLAVSDVDRQEAERIGHELLEKKGISGATLSFEPIPSADLPRGTTLFVEISAPVAGNCTLISGLFSSRSLEANSTVSREVGDTRLPPVITSSKKRGRRSK